jgi:hypothetical protein
MAGLSELEYLAVRRTLVGRRFGGELRRAIRAVVRQFPSLVNSDSPLR